MQHLFFVEGFSEENFIESFLLINNFEFTKDFSEIRSFGKEIYVVNCQNDSTIKPSIKKISWWIQELDPDTSIIWIISDLKESVCYSQNKDEHLIFLRENEIHQELILINSRPYLEDSYFDNPHQILNTTLSLHNTLFPNNLLNSPEDLADTNLILDPPGNKFEALKTFCRTNLEGHFSKKEFSEKFFFRLHNENPDLFINISKRLETYLSRY